LRHRLDAAITVTHLAGERLLFLPETSQALEMFGQFSLTLRQGLLEGGTCGFQPVHLPDEIITLALDLSQLLALLGIRGFKSRQLGLHLAHGSLDVSEFAFLAR
jgi:hypothetical protein